MALRYALVRESDGLVLNIIELDDPEEYPPAPGEYVVLIDGIPALSAAQIGDTILEGVLYPAPPPPDPIWHRGVHVHDSNRETIEAATELDLPLIVECADVDLKLYIDDATELCELQSACS